MDIVVVSRHTEVPERFRRHVEDKLSKIEQLQPYAQRVDVQIVHEANPRMAEVSERVELTVRAKGPTVRAEASASDRYAALDLAMAKLLERLRRHQDRRKNRHARARAAREVRQPEPLVDLTPDEPEPEEEHALVPGIAVERQLGDSPVVIREKIHETSPMSIDDAVAEMELVGHPFFLFIDSESQQPAVVYRRKGWTYGVIRLNTRTATDAAAS